MGDYFDEDDLLEEYMNEQDQEEPEEGPQLAPQQYDEALFDEFAEEPTTAPPPPAAAAPPPPTAAPTTLPLQASKQQLPTTPQLVAGNDNRNDEFDAFDDLDDAAMNNNGTDRAPIQEVTLERRRDPFSFERYVFTRVMCMFLLV